MITDSQKNSFMAEIVIHDEEIARLEVIAFKTTYQQPEKRIYQQPEKKTLKGILENEIKKQNKEIEELLEQIVASDKEVDDALAATEDAYAEERWFGVW